MSIHWILSQDLVTLLTMVSGTLKNLYLRSLSQAMPVSLIVTKSVSPYFLK